VPSHLQSEEEPALPDGPFFLQCPYCQWTTLDIGLQFDKPNGIFKQLSEIKNGGDHLPSQRERDKERTKKIDLLDKRRHPEDYRYEDRLKSDEAKALYPDDEPASDPPEHDELFGNLAAFYRSQLTKEKSSNDHSRHSKYLSRLLNTTGKPQRPDTKPRPMAEARNISEGLSLLSFKSETATIERMKELGWDGSLSQEQRLAQPVPTTRFHSSLRPVPTLLRTKRTKRCRTCRQILSRPENKVTSTRYKIKLLALNQIPRISVRALSGPPPAAAWSSTNVIPPFNYESLSPLVPTQFLLTLINPLFDPIRVTLATAATTPGRIQSKVTILCPEFEVGANTDVWDEALGDGPAKRRPVSMIGDGSADGGSGAVQAEAGKIWEKGRNWTSVIVEVIPGSSQISELVQFGAKEPGESSNVKLNLNGCYDSDDEEDDGALEEDEDVLEIPVFVRIEYDTEPAGEDRDGGGTRSDMNKGKERREEAFWCVLGCGRIAQI
jgi:dynactin 4